MSQIFLFLVLILKYIKSESCSQLDCLSCNSLSSCKYENSLCLSDDTNDSKINFFRKLKSCKSDPSSYSLMIKYCGNLDYTFQGKEINIQLNKINNQYGISNLFCIYSIKNENYKKRDFYIKTKRNDFSFDLYMEIMSSTNLYEIDTKKILYTIPKKYEGIYLMYYNNFPSDKLPFEVIISKNKNDFNYIIIIVCSFMIIIIIILLIILLFLYRKKEHEYLDQFNRRIQEREEENNLNEINKNIAKEFCEKLVSTVFNLVQDSSKNSVCSFCLNEFKMDDVVYMGNCKHVFHFDEIKKWFYSEDSFNNTCPECRNEFIQFYHKGDNLNEPLSSQIQLNNDNNDKSNDNNSDNNSENNSDNNNDNNSGNNNDNNNNNNSDNDNSDNDNNINIFKNKKNNNDNIPNLINNDVNENNIQNPNVVTFRSNCDNARADTLHIRDNGD